MIDTITQTFDYVYIIADEQGYVKVGISKHPEKRLKQLQTGHPTKLSLIFTEEFECTRDHLLKIEKEIHKDLRNFTKKVHGEWFLLQEDQLEKIKNTVIINRILYDANPLAFKYR